MRKLFVSIGIVERGLQQTINVKEQSAQIKNSYYYYYYKHQYTED